MWQDEFPFCRESFGLQENPCISFIQISNLSTMDFHAFHRVKRTARPLKNRFTSAGSLPSTRRAPSPGAKCFRSTRRAPSLVVKCIRSTRQALFTLAGSLPSTRQGHFTRCKVHSEHSPSTFHLYKELQKP